MPTRKRKAAAPKKPSACDAAKRQKLDFAVIVRPTGPFEMMVLLIKATDTVQELKRLISSRMPAGVDMGASQLLFKNAMMPNEATMEAMGIEYESVVELRVVNPVWQITLIDDNNHYDLFVECDATIGAVKQHMQNLHDKPKSAQLLVYDGRRLTDDQATLLDCGIVDKAKIYMLMRPPQEFQIATKI